MYILQNDLQYDNGNCCKVDYRGAAASKNDIRMLSGLK